MSISIRKTVPLAILVPLLTCVGIIGGISFYNGQRTVDDLTTRLSESIGGKVKERLERYLQTPHDINKANANAIELGQFNWQDPDTVDRYYRAQSRLYPDVDAIELGYEQSGDLREVLRTADDQLHMILRDSNTNGAITTYELNRDDSLGRQLSSTPNYDARKRDWYKLAVQAGKPIWTPPSLKASTKQLRLSAVHPISEPNTRKLIGVQAVELFLASVSDFLRSLKVSTSGQVFIVERSGELIASSSTAPILAERDKTLTRVRAIDSQDPLIRATAQYVEQHNGLNSINGDQQLHFSVGGEVQLAYITPYKDEFGLDWLVFIVVPEKDFMQGVHHTRHLTLLIGAIALLSSVLLGVFATRWLVHPILQLNAAAIEVKNHTFDATSLAHLVRRPDELGQLAQVFEDMAQVILAREQTLEDQVQQLQKETDSAKKAALATRNGLNLGALLARSQQVRHTLEHQQQQLIDQLRSISYFAAFNHTQLQVLIDQGYQLRLPINHVICRENQAGNTIYLILAGSIAVERSQNTHDVLSAGSCFGELSLLLGAPHSATIRTLEETTLFIVDQKGLQTLLHQSPELSEAILQKLTTEADLGDRTLIQQQFQHRYLLSAPTLSL